MNSELPPSFRRLLQRTCALLIPTVQVLADPFATLKSFGVLSEIPGHYPQSQLVQGVDGTLYGTCSGGEGSVVGTIFKLQPDGSGFAVLKWLTNSTLEGAYPQAGLVLSGNVLYGTAYGGGPSNVGTVFKLNTDGSGYTVLRAFTNTPDGATPYAALALSGSTLYGTTYSGGPSNLGTVFKVNTDGSGCAVLKAFTNSADGANPYAGLTLAGSTLYGTTVSGGAYGDGTVFALNADGTGFSVLYSFTNVPDGAGPHGELLLSGSTLCGTTYGGGVSGYGTVFQLSTNGTNYTVLYSFMPDAQNPYGGLVLSGNMLYGTTSYGGLSNRGTVFRLSTDGSTYDTLHSFTNSPDGYELYAGLLLSGSTLYGTTFRGGSGAQDGTVFKINTDGGGYAILKDFTYSTEASSPYAALTLAGNTLYGTTVNGGASGLGTVFQMTTDGSGYTVLWNFTNPATGANPYGNLTLSGGTLYGTAEAPSNPHYGTVYKVNSDGSGYTVLRSFTNSPDANIPYGGLALLGGTLYGTSVNGGGGGGLGTIFKVNTDGSGYGVVYRFISTSGYHPYAGLVVSGGTLFGVAYQGGNFRNNSSGNGTVFKVNTDGTSFTMLRTFTNSPDGSSPYGGVVLSGGTLYGTTVGGGPAGDGTVFKVNTNGTGYAILKTFSGSDGMYPRGTLILHNDTLYGTTYYGGKKGYGTVFQMNTNGGGFMVLKSFTVSDGWNPYAGLTWSDATLYGATYYGGELNLGTVFALNLPLLFVSGSPGFANQQFVCALTGPAGSNAVVSASTDLSTWTPLATNQLVNGTFTFSDPGATNFPQRCYRAMLLP